MNVPASFWIFQRDDGHVIGSALGDSYVNADVLDAESWDPDDRRPEGEWSLVTRDQWDTLARLCLQGKCTHEARTRVRGRKVEPHPVKPAPPTTPETWTDAVATFTPAFNLIKDHLIMLWNSIKPVVDHMIDMAHTLRVDGDHADLCPANTKGTMCFCSCAACFEEMDEEHPNICVCSACECRVKP